MTRVIVSPRAQTDFDEVAAYLRAEAGLRVAEKYADKFRGHLLRLRDFPGIGAPRPGFGRGVRMIAERPYVIFYEERDIVLILRVLDGRRKITRKLVREV